MRFYINYRSQVDYDFNFIVDTEGLIKVIDSQANVVHCKPGHVVFV